MINIIKLSPDRWQEYRDLRLEALKSEPQAFLSSYDEQSRESDESWQKRASKSLPKTFFAEEDGKLIGMGGYELGKRLKEKHVANIYAVYVNPDYRGQGVGKQLMTTVLAEINSHPEITKIKLGVIVSQTPAHNLYKWLGFIEVGRLKNEIKIGDTYYDEILMEIVK